MFQPVVVSVSDEDLAKPVITDQPDDFFNPVSIKFIKDIIEKHDWRKT